MASELLPVRNLRNAFHIFCMSYGHKIISRWLLWALICWSQYLVHCVKQYSYPASFISGDALKKKNPESKYLNEWAQTATLVQNSATVTEKQHRPYLN